MLPFAYDDNIAMIRYPGAVKAAILQALNILLEKGGTSLKAFAPQLQTSFVKMLNDPMKACRSRAVLGLEKLMPLTTRVDPLLQGQAIDLNTFSRSR